MTDKTTEAGREVMVTIHVMVPSMLASGVPELQAAVYAVVKEIEDATVDVSMRTPSPPMLRR